MVKASATHVGVVLQDFLCGTWAPLSFFSRKLMSAETHYSAFNHDLLRFTQLSTTSSSCSRDPADAPGFHHCLGSFGSSTLCLKQTIMQNPDPGNGGLMGGFKIVGLDIGSCEKGGTYLCSLFVALPPNLFTMLWQVSVAPLPFYSSLFLYFTWAP